MACFSYDLYTLCFKWYKSEDFDVTDKQRSNVWQQRSGTLPKKKINANTPGACKAVGSIAEKYFKIFAWNG